MNQSEDDKNLLKLIEEFNVIKVIGGSSESANNLRNEQIKKRGEILAEIDKSKINMIYSLDVLLKAAIIIHNKACDNKNSTVKGNFAEDWIKMNFTMKKIPSGKINKDGL